MKKKKKLFRKKDIPLYIMMLPTIIVLVLFDYIPMGGLVLAFKKYHVGKGIFGSPWNGFKNFEFLFASTDSAIIVRNTILYNLAFIVLGTILAVALAIILGEIFAKRAAKVFQTVYMMPYFLSWAAVAIFVEAYLSTSNGVVNQIAEAMGGAGKTNWYNEKQIWPFLLVFIYLWKTVGYSTVLYMASISGIPQDQYEAAMLDGASRFQQHRFITLPGLSMIICLTLITSLGNIFRSDFGLFYLVTKNTGALYSVTQNLDTYIYNGLKGTGNLGMTTAAGLFQSVIGFLTLIGANKIVSMINSENSLF